jgi:hypothetical protein
MTIKEELIMKTKAYRPSNGTEGEIFMEKYCERCIHDDLENDNGCKIIAFSLAYSIGDPEYPKEWIYGEPIESAKTDRSPKLPENCPKNHPGGFPL